MKCYIGFDDTDNLDANVGTGKLARRFEALLPETCRLLGVVRQQLLVDDRIPYTSHNSSACVLVDVPDPGLIHDLRDRAVRHIESESLTGSDPGFSVTVYPVDGSAPLKGGRYVWPTPMSWSHDGRLAFAGAPGNADWQASTVWVWKPGSGKPAKILAPTKLPITSLAWSPKASQIAYAVGRGNGQTSDLWVSNADGSSPHLLLGKASWPAWAQAPISFP